MGTQTLTTAGTYTEVFTSAAGCDSTVTLTLNVEPLLTCNITAPTTALCEGESVTLSVNTTGGPGASSHLPANLQQGLVAYYPFNGNANDESGNGNNGTVYGATLAQDRFGNLESAYHFDGNDMILAESSSSLEPSDAVTIATWVKLLPGNTNGTMFGKAFVHGEGSYGFNTGFGGNSFVASAGSRIAGVNGNITPGSFNLWYHMCATFDNTGGRIYLNGELKGSAPFNQNLIYNGNRLFMGVSNDPSIAPFVVYLTGLLDDAGIWNRALTSSEIQQLYSTQSYAWSTGATTPSITVTPTTNTTYSCTVTQGNSTCTASVDITVNPNVTNTISATIIEGETYTLGTQTLTTAGTYTEVFTSAAGCDSTVTLTLAVDPLLTCEITTPTTSLCEGESVTLSVNTTGGASPSSQLPANLQQGLVAYYPFNGNANDESGNGNDGVVNGATLTSDRFGNVGSAYSFNGSSSIIPTNNHAPISNNFTYSVWVLPTIDCIIPNASQSANAASNFVDNPCVIHPIHGVTFGEENNSAGSGLYVGTNGLYIEEHSGGWEAVPLNYIGNLNGWHLITVVYNASIPSLYIDGNYISSGLASSRNIYLPLGPDNFPSYHNSGFGAGYYPPFATAQYFYGDIDDLYFYNRPLTSIEIQQLYTAQSYAWSNGASNPTITVTPTENTTYNCTVTQGNQTCTASVDITVNFNVTNAISASIIEGESYTFGTQTLTTAGTFTEIFTSTAGCDSTVTLTLAVEPLLTCEITAPTTTLCEGESVTLSVNTTGGAGASSQLPSNLQQGLVAYYPFNGNANDESGNGNDGVVFGADVANDRMGNAGSAYHFNGTGSYIKAPANGFPLNNRTINIWLFPESSETRIVCGYGGSGICGNSFLLNLKMISCEGFDKITMQSHCCVNVSSTDYSNILPGQWNMLTYSQDSDGIRWYVNGNMVFFQFSNFSTFVAENSDFGIGTGVDYSGIAPFFDGNANPFHGWLDDITIHNRALSPSEIQQLYTAQSYAWSNNANTPSITISPTQSTTYSCTVTGGSQTCTSSIDVTVNPLLTWYADADGDGFGNANGTTQACDQPAGFVADNSDCNDNSNTTYLGAEEICFDQVDNNCNGTVDENCAIYGCINSNACNFNPAANTDDGSCILPQPEICDEMDNDCDGWVNEDLMPADLNSTPVVTAVYPVCTTGNLFSANLNNGANSAVIEGDGPDLWYRLTAQYNTLRVGLTAAAGDNSIQIYQDMNGCLMLVSEEHELTSGNQILLTDGLVTGETYYVAIHQNAAPTNPSAKVCFTHLLPSICDHAYSGNTGEYSSVCRSFKAEFRAQASQYIFNVLEMSQMGSNTSITPWNYTTPTASSILTRLGILLPANTTGSSQVYTLSIPALYQLLDAAGNMSILQANAINTCELILQPESGVSLRSSDRCPNVKAINQSIATDRSICGAQRYEWELTQVMPTAQAPITVLGGLNTNFLFLNTVPGMANGKTYNVRVRPIHSTGVVGEYGAAHCMKTTGAGMVMENHPGSAEPSHPSSLSQALVVGEMVSLFPNPTVDGQVTLLWNERQEGSKELILRDVQGRIVWNQKVVLEGNVLELDWKTLDTGIYLLEVDGQTLRVVKG